MTLLVGRLVPLLVYFVLIVISSCVSLRLRKKHLIVVFSYNSQTGKLLRESKELWRDCLTLACAYDMASTDTVPTIRPAGTADGQYFADVVLW